MQNKSYYLALSLGYLVFIPFACSLETAPPVQVKEEMFPAIAQEILEFWFGPLKSPSDYPGERAIIWFASAPEIDRQIQEKFSEYVRKAVVGELNQWRETPRGRLALILLLDLFPRRIYRNKPQAFASEAMVRGLVIEGLQKGDDRKLFPIERAFFYLPLQHAEDINLQNLSVEYYKQLLSHAPESLRPQLEAFLRSATLHQQIIVRFNRFPHRNQILGRESTPEEIIYLNQQGSVLN